LHAELEPTLPTHSTGPSRGARASPRDGRRCLKGVDSRSKGAPEFVAIDEESNYEIVHTFRLGEAQRATH